MGTNNPMTPLYNRDGWVWQDGEWRTWLSCFEGVRAYAGPNGTHLFRAAEHARRLAESGHSLDMPLSFNEAELINARCECLTNNGLNNAYLKPIVFFGLKA